MRTKEKTPMIKVAVFLLLLFTWPFWMEYFTDNVLIPLANASKVQQEQDRFDMLRRQAPKTGNWRHHSAQSIGYYGDDYDPASRLFPDYDNPDPRQW